MNFLPFYNSCTRNGDPLNLLIKIGNAHIRRILSQTVINASKKCKEGRIKRQTMMMVAAKWWSFSQLQK